MILAVQFVRFLSNSAGNRVLNKNLLASMGFEPRTDPYAGSEGARGAHASSTPSHPTAVEKVRKVHLIIKTHLEALIFTCKTISIII
mgnify:CR=1 FL=1